jgi:hypothetical protein
MGGALRAALGSLLCLARSPGTVLALVAALVLVIRRTSPSPLNDGMPGVVDFDAHEVIAHL